MLPGEHQLVSCFDPISLVCFHYNIFSLEKEQISRFLPAKKEGTNVANTAKFRRLTGACENDRLTL